MIVILTIVLVIVFVLLFNYGAHKKEKEMIDK